MTDVRIERYLDGLRAELRGLPSRVVDEAVAEIRAHLAECADAGADVGELLAGLGSPHDYAEEVRAAIIPDEQVEGARPQGRLLGMPYDFRGPSTDRVGSRMWNPADPRIFTPRTFGLGWTLNFGALAVRLGLIRPDDTDAEQFERAPAAVVWAALAVPALLALTTALLLALKWSSLPAEVPVHWGPGGTPDGWAPKAVGAGIVLAFGVLPVVVTYVRVLRRGVGQRARVLAASVLSLFSALGVALAIMTIQGDRSHPVPLWAALVGGIVIGFFVLYVPARLGLRAEWRDLGDREG
ncbi:MAG: hypothetical protein Kow0067_04350 [Coriobacteriia bacterium]